MINCPTFCFVVDVKSYFDKLCIISVSKIKKYLFCLLYIELYCGYLSVLHFSEMRNMSMGAFYF